RKIVLTERDVRRIQKLGLATKFYRENRFSTKPYRYEMVKKDGCCIFLSGDRCTIYERRPLICRFYPFTMSESDGYAFGVDRTCRGVGLGRLVDEGCVFELVQEAERTIGQAR
ncbi:MAG: YkgJ family cysteine cluster protein, partial [Nitrososphaerales archaeon]